MLLLDCLINFFLILGGQIVILILLDPMHILSGTMLQHINLIEHVLLRHVAPENAKSLPWLHIGRRMEIQEWISLVEKEAELVRLLIVGGSGGGLRLDKTQVGNSQLVASRRCILLVAHELSLLDQIVERLIVSGCDPPRFTV